MPKVLIIYDSRTGNTEKMAKAVAQGVREADVDVVIKRVDKAVIADLKVVDGIIFGSPTYFGIMTDKMKRFIDESIGVWGKLSNKVGAAFSSALWLGGGNETTVLSLIQAMLAHEMIIVGGALKSNEGIYGPVSLSAPDAEASNACRLLGKRVAELVKKLA